MSIFATKSIEQLKAEAADTGGHSLKRVLGPINLVTLGVGAIIGTGIFVLTGQAAAQYAGPGIVLSMVLAGFASALAGLCYAEFASTVPIAGSAYTYGYATLGEFIAWIIGWDLILEYALGAATVAVGWSDISTASSTISSASPFLRRLPRPRAPSSPRPAAALKRSSTCRRSSSRSR
jgi:APA family basic amino acid/polyamine antiporter